MKRSTFRGWASVFTEGATIRADWKQSGRFEFFDSSSNEGSYGVIDRLLPNQFISFRRLGETRDGSDQPFSDGPKFENKHAPGRERQHHRDAGQDVPEEHRSMFEEATPRAFDRIRQLAEQGL